MEHVTGLHLDSNNSSLRSAANTSAQDDYEMFFNNFQKYQNIVMRTLLVLGIAGNTVNLFVLTRPTLRGVTFVYLFWLAISDLCFLLINFLGHVIYSIDSEVRFHNYHVMFGLCRLSFAASNLFCGSSAFLVTVLTIDRHRAVLTPFKGKHTLSRKRAFVRISLTFLLAFVINVPLVFQTNVESFTDEVISATGGNGTALYVHKEVYLCEPTSIEENWSFKAYVVFREGISKAATVLIVTILNIRIIIALRKQGTERKSLTCSAQRSRSAEEQKLVQLLLAIVIVFLVCTTPQMIFWVSFSKDLLGSRTWLILDALGESLLVLNAAANFYIYCFSSVAVRGTLLALLRSCLRSPRSADINSPWTTSASVPNETTQLEKVSLAASRSETHL